MFDNNIICFDDLDKAIKEHDVVEIYDINENDPVYTGVVIYSRSLTAFVLADPDTGKTISETPVGVLAKNRKIYKAR